MSFFSRIEIWMFWIEWKAYVNIQQLINVFNFSIFLLFYKKRWPLHKSLNTLTNYSNIWFSVQRSSMNFIESVYITAIWIIFKDNSCFRLYFSVHLFSSKWCFSFLSPDSTIETIVHPWLFSFLFYCSMLW